MGLELRFSRVTHSLVKGGLGLGLFSIIDFPCLEFSVFLFHCDDRRRRLPSYPSSYDSLLGVKAKMKA